MRSLGLPKHMFFISITLGLIAGACGGGEGPDSDPEGEPLWEMVDASGVAITQISVTQGVKVVLMENGQPGPGTVPLVAGRDALMRVGLALDGNYNGEPVVARLHVDGAKEPIEIVAPAVSGPPAEDNLATTFNIPIPGASIPAGFSYRLELLQPRGQSKGENPAAHYPVEGFSPTNAIPVGQTLKIVLVPIQYGGDGSNRLPDTSEQMVNGYRDYFYGMYPVPQVEMTLHAPVQWNQDVEPFGYGWQELLGYISQLRQQEQAAFDVYYYGIFSPANSINQYCGQGCVAGLSNLAFGPGDAYSRASIGLGFSEDGGALAFETAVHEVGHAHGRQHSPCGGAQGTDPSYPHSNATLGTWGYNLLTGQIYNPDAYKDVMGYCVPIWVSDFTFVRLMDRIKAVNQAKIVVPPELLNLTYDRAYVDPGGELHRLPSMQMEMPPQGEAVEMDVETSGEVATVSGHYYPYSHLEGGVFVWPQVGGAGAAVTIPWKGSYKTLLGD
jgi:hypothetical protein